MEKARLRIYTLLALLLLDAASAFAQVTTGRDFWVTLLPNSRDGEIPEPALWISANESTTGSVTNPNTGWQEDFSVEAGCSVYIPIPLEQAFEMHLSDTTLNHLMLHKVGLKTFYGQAFLSDLCEIGPEMPAYSRAFFEELISTGGIRQVRPSSVWYEERKDYGPSQVGTPLVSHPDRGFERLQGPSAFSGKILGGCIDSLHDIFDGERYADMPVLCERYHLFPDAEDWKGRILLLETSEET